MIFTTWKNPNADKQPRTKDDPTQPRTFKVTYEYSEPETVRIPVTIREDEPEQPHNIAPKERFLIMDEWSNNACEGYSILAMQAAGLDAKTIRRVLDQMRNYFDSVSVEEAAEVQEP